MWEMCWNVEEWTRKVKKENVGQMSDMMFDNRQVTYRSTIQSVRWVVIFLCPNGTLFHQQYFICDWWFNVDCSLAESFYGLNEEVAAAAAAANGDRSGRADESEEIIDVTDIRAGNSLAGYRRNALGRK